MLIKRLTNDNINSNMLRSIYHWRFNVYSKNFLNQKAPSYKQHIQFLNQSLDSSNEILFGVFISRFNNDLYFVGCGSIYNFNNSSCEFGRLMISPSYLG